jgi:Glycosyl Hydrolase Family 88
MMPTTRRDLLLATLALPAAAHATESPSMASRLAEHYPIKAPLSYITALIWSAQRRLNGGRLPPRSQQALLSLREVTAAIPPTTSPLDWPQRAGCAAFAEAAHHDGDATARQLALQALRSAIADTPDGPRLAGLRSWTDDLFMAALLFDRAMPLLPAAEQSRATEALGASLLALAGRLQRSDGLFDHADDSPIAWGRGNGFALLALTQALAGPLPTGSVVGKELLARLQRQLRALLPLQGSDGLWRQVLDEPGSASELTVTAMSVSALATARTHSWLPAAAVVAADAAIDRAWAGVLTRVNAEGAFRDVCAGTPAGPTLDFYLQRPMLRGRDDRAAAMVLQAALAVAARR